MSEGVTFYHGTSKRYLDSIRAEGLVPGAKPGAHPGEGKNYTSANVVYFTDDPELAAVYAYSIGKRHNAKGAVLAIDVPAAVYEMEVRMPPMAAGGFSLLGNEFYLARRVPPGWIAPELVKVRSTASLKHLASRRGITSISAAERSMLPLW